MIHTKHLQNKSEYEYVIIILRCIHINRQKYQIDTKENKYLKISDAS